MTDKVIKNSTIELGLLLKKATKNEIDEIREMLRGSSLVGPPEVIAKQIVGLGRHESYLWMLCEVAKKIKTSSQISYEGNLQSLDSNGPLADNSFLCEQILKLESLILEGVFAMAYKNMSPMQKLDFDRKVRDIAIANGKNMSGVGGAAAAMLLAELGGFATFTLLSSVLGAISFGLLPFGVYTAASSVLGTVLGPVGWVGLGLFALAKLGEPDFKKTIPIVIKIAIIRSRISDEAEKKVMSFVGVESVNSDVEIIENGDVEDHELKVIIMEMVAAGYKKSDIGQMLIFYGASEAEANILINKYCKNCL